MSLLTLRLWEWPGQGITSKLYLMRHNWKDHRNLSWGRNNKIKESLINYELFGSIWIYCREIVVWCLLGGHLWRIWRGISKLRKGKEPSWPPDSEGQCFRMHKLPLWRAWCWRRGHIVMEWLLHFPACRSGPRHRSGSWHVGLVPQNPCYDHSVRALSIHFLSILLFHQLAITRHRKCTQKGLVLVTMWLGGRELWLVADSLGWLGMGYGNGGWNPSSVPRVLPQSHPGACE